MTMRFGKLAVRLLLLVLLPALLPALVGQDQPGFSAGMWANVMRVPAGERLKMKLKDGSTLKGVLSGVSDTGLALSQAGTTSQIEQGRIARIHRVFRKSAKKHTLIGAGIGLGTFLVLHAALYREEPWPTHRKDATEIPTAVGIGALVGYGVGHRERQELIYDAAVLTELSATQ